MNAFSAALPKPDRLVKEVSHHQDRIITIDGKVDLLQQDLTKFKSDITELKIDIAQITQTLAEHTIRLDVLEDKVDAGFALMVQQFNKVFQLLGAE